MQLVGSRVRILALSLAWAPMFLQAAQPGFSSDPWKLVLPEAKWILGVDWARARHSAAGQILSRQFRGAESRLEASGLGLQAVASLERLIASGASLEMKDQDGPQGLLVAIEGAIDRTRLKQSLPPGTALERFRGADLFVPPKSRPGEPLVALIGSRWMLVGDRPSLALILSGRGGPADASLYGRAAKLASNGEIWLAVSAAAVPSSASAAADGLAALREFDLVLSLQRGLHMEASLTGESPGLARSLSSLLPAAGTGSQPAAAAWLRRLDLAVNGNQLRFSLDLPPEELERAIGQAKASAFALGQRALESVLASEGAAAAGQARLAASQTSAGAVEPPVPPAPKVRTVRIVGLDEGPKALPYGSPPAHPR